MELTPKEIKQLLKKENPIILEVGSDIGGGYRKIFGNI